MSAKRKKNVAAEDRAMFLSRFECCVCRERGDHIHHLDGNTENTFEDNLVFLCLKHHADASEINPLRRKLSKGALLQCREDHYARIATWREGNVLSVSNNTREHRPDELISASITASALIEIERVEYDYLYGDRKKREDALGRLDPFSKYNEPRIGYAILEFVMSAAHHTRFGFTRSECGSLVQLAIHFYPSNQKSAAVGHEQFDIMALSAGSAMTYDAAIHLNKLYPALEGLTLIKYVHTLGSRRHDKECDKLVEDCISGLLGQLDRPDRDDLDMFKQLILEFKNNMSDGDLSYPMFSTGLMAALNNEARATVLDNV